ncbi:pinensin family lanthipeptide [Fulvivirga ulvae]
MKAKNLNLIQISIKSFVTHFENSNNGKTLKGGVGRRR